MNYRAKRTVLLQVLLLGNGYGLELIERARKWTGGHMVISQASIYPILRKMEREGLIQSYEGETVPERRGRPRIYYRLASMSHIPTAEPSAGS